MERSITTTEWKRNNAAKTNSFTEDENLLEGETEVGASTDKKKDGESHLSEDLVDEPL